MHELKDSGDIIQLIILNEIMKKLDRLEKKVDDLAKHLNTGAAPTQQVYKLKEVAEILQISKSKTYELLQTGKLASFRVGNNYRIPQKAVEEYINRENRSDANA